MKFKQEPRLIRKRIDEVEAVVLTAEPGEDLDEIALQLIFACIPQLNREEKEMFRKELSNKRQVVREYWKGEPVFISIEIRDENRIVFSLRKLLKRWHDLDGKDSIPDSAIKYINDILKKAETKIDSEKLASGIEVKAIVAQQKKESYQQGIISRPKIANFDDPPSFFEIILALVYRNSLYWFVE